MNAQIRQRFGTVGWFVQLLGGCFRQESAYPTFLSFGSPCLKPHYLQESWLGQRVVWFRLNMKLQYQTALQQPCCKINVK